MLGKNANCQTLVSLTLASGEVPVPLALRLFLPESWTTDVTRLDKVGVPPERRHFRSKPEMALEEIDRVLAAGVRFGVVLTDAGYGASAAFRRGLSERDLLWGRGRAAHPQGLSGQCRDAGATAQRKRAAAEAGRARPDLAAGRDRARAGRLAGGELEERHQGSLCRARFAASRVRVADGPAQQIGGRPAQHLPGEEVWLVGESRASGERKYYLSNLPADADLRTLASAIKARWSCEQAHQQMKEELGLDHFEGRSWMGLHRHALLTMIAFAFLQHRRLTQAKRGKNRPLASTPTEPARHPADHHRGPRTTTPAHQMPALPTMDQALA